MKLNSRNLALAAWLMLLLAGCGGGDNSPGGESTVLASGNDTAGGRPSPCDTPAEGVMTTLPSGIFGGTIEGQTDGAFVLVTRDLWGTGTVEGRLFYGLDVIGPPKVTGVVAFGPNVGCSAVDTRARNGREYARAANDWSQPNVFVFVALDPAVPSLTGSIRTLDGTQPTRRLTGGSIPGSTFDVKATPSLVNVVGGWTFVDPLGNPNALAVSNDGKLQGTYRGCSVGGTVQPSVDGTNLFEVQLKAKPCEALVWLQDFKGFALAMPLATGGMRLLLWAEANNGIDWSYVLAVGQS
jgi:hypothetical protein